MLLYCLVMSAVIANVVCFSSCTTITHVTLLSPCQHDEGKHAHMGKTQTTGMPSRERDLKVLEQLCLSLSDVIVGREGAIHSILTLYQLAFQGFDSELGACFALFGRELHPFLSVIALLLALLALASFLQRNGQGGSAH